MKKTKDGWQFVIESIGYRGLAYADGITVTDAGWLKLWRHKQLVGVIRDGHWTRIYLDARQDEIEKMKTLALSHGPDSQS